MQPKLPRLAIDDTNAAIYTVGQVSSMLGVQPAFLRRLDVESLVSPSRSDGGQRRYSRSEIGQVRRVSDLAGEGMSLAGIRRILLLEAQLESVQEELACLRQAQTDQGPV